MKVFIEMNDWKPIAQFLTQIPDSDFSFQFIIDDDEDEMQAYTYLDDGLITVAITRDEEDDLIVLGHECVHLLQHVLGLPISEEQAYALEGLACDCLIGKRYVKDLIREMTK